MPFHVGLNAKQLASHKHIIGVSGVGKSKLLESIFLQLHRQEVGVSFIDPHGDSAEAILQTLVSRGYFQRADAYKRVLYIEFSETDHFLPFNILQDARTLPHTLVSNVLEAFHRCWPALDDGAAPRFDNLVEAGCKLLIDNELPITALHNLLTDKGYREQLLANATDPDIAAFFVDRFDEWNAREAPQMIESTLSRIFLLTFSPVLKYSLGQAENVLDFRELMDQGVAVIYNLSRIRDRQARRLLGCLLTIGYENAALSRSDFLLHKRVDHHLLLDEFADYCAQSERALTTMLSETRKFGLFCTLAHQTWSQASERLQGALQNVGVKIAFRIGRQDAEVFARALGAVDAQKVKAEALVNQADEPKNHPVFLELQAQWEQWIATLTDLPPRHALVKLAGKPTVQIKTLKVPAAEWPDVGQPDQIKREYRRSLMKAVDQISLIHQQLRGQAATLGLGRNGRTLPTAYTRLYNLAASGRDDLERR